MAVYQDNEARVALNAPNTACTDERGSQGHKKEKEKLGGKGAKK